MCVFFCVSPPHLHAFISLSLAELMAVGLGRSLGSLRDRTEGRGLAPDDTLEQDVNLSSFTGAVKSLHHSKVASGWFSGLSARVSPVRISVAGISVSGSQVILQSPLFDCLNVFNPSDSSKCPYHRPDQSFLKCTITSLLLYVSL